MGNAPGTNSQSMTVSSAAGHGDIDMHSVTFSDVQRKAEDCLPTPEVNIMSSGFFPCSPPHTQNPLILPSYVPPEMSSNVEQFTSFSPDTSPSASINEKNGINHHDSTYVNSSLACKLNSTSLSEAVLQNLVSFHNKLPCVFKWTAGGYEVHLSGSFNDWKVKIPMVKSEDIFYTIVELSPGRHEYKFHIDGRWYHDPGQPTVCNQFGTLNNVIEVRPSDFNVLSALEADMMECEKRHETVSPTRRIRSQSGVEGAWDDADYGQLLPNVTVMAPPQLPKQLLQINLNHDTAQSCDPNLLPQPHHVMVNHLYALSIKDGVIVLSCITRHRQKFVTTVFYKPI